MPTEKDIIAAGGAVLDQVNSRHLYAKPSPSEFIDTNTAYAKKRIGSMYEQIVHALTRTGEFHKTCRHLYRRMFGLEAASVDHENRTVHCNILINLIPMIAYNFVYDEKTLQELDKLYLKYEDQLSRFAEIMPDPDTLLDRYVPLVKVDIYKKTVTMLRYIGPEIDCAEGVDFPSLTNEVTNLLWKKKYSLTRFSIHCGTYSHCDAERDNSVVGAIYGRLIEIAISANRELFDSINEKFRMSSFFREHGCVTDMITKENVKYSEVLYRSSVYGIGYLLGNHVRINILSGFDVNYSNRLRRMELHQGLRPERTDTRPLHPVTGLL